ncbi:GNAT family N-acetyltransferase [Promicromonospora sp. NPDC057488]|uniref:GNAT family N-acetyltransferase n=1 Tax=Promicromonospora sp. NPDC057488 TaxID=3346147 RepID=UPI0036729EE8
MIIRRSTAHVRPGLLDEFRAFIEAGTVGFAALDGFVSDEIVVGPDTLTYVSRWRDAAALAAYAGPRWRTEPVVLEDEDQFLVEPLVVRHVELRRAVPEDAPVIADVWHAAWGDGHRGLVPAALEAARTRDSFGPRAAARVPGTTVAVVDDPALDDPALDNPVLDGSAVDSPAADGPAVEGPAVDGPAVEGGAADRPAVDGMAELAESRIVGFVTVRGEELEQLFVAATHRGSGIAADLLSAGEARIAAAGHPEAWLAVVAGNTRARRFYERAGWSDGGPLDYQAETPEGPVPVSTRRYLRRLR